MRCGRVTTPVREPPGELRDLAFEQDFTRLAAKGVANPDLLIQHAEARAASGPYPIMTLREGMDWTLEAREELADARNYLCWRARELLERDATLEQRAVLVALRHVTLAYSVLDGG